MTHREPLLEECRDGLLVVDVVDRLGQQVCHRQLDDLRVVSAVAAEGDGVEHHHLRLATMRKGPDGRNIGSPALAKKDPFPPSLGVGESRNSQKST